MVLTVKVPTTLSGVVVFKKKPVYYVTKVGNSDDEMIIAYRLSEQSLLKYQETHDYNVLEPAYKMTKVEQPNYSNQSLIVRTFNLHPQPAKVTYEKRYLPAVFASDIMYANDSFTNDYCLGFYEQTTNNNQYLRGLSVNVLGAKSYERAYPPERSTGIFIGLQHIVWLAYGLNLDEWGTYLNDLYLHYHKGGALLD